LSTVLVVAAAESRSSLVNVLREAGYVVKEADSAESALEIAQTASPALILMTIVMPRNNGLQVAAKLRQQLNSNLPPIILLGTITPIGIDEEPLASLVSGYLHLDVSSAELLAAVRSHIGNPQSP